MTKALTRFTWKRSILLLLFAVPWIRSAHDCDLLALFGRQGKVQIVGSDQGRLILATSNIEFGPERNFTVTHVRPEPEQTDHVRSLLYQTPPLPKRVAGIYIGGTGPGAFGIPAARYGYIVIPLLYPTILAALWLLLGLRTFWLRRKWGTGTLCNHCGYDTQASTDRCPECGTTIRAKAKQSPLPV